jgi:hypothetical protein
MKVLDILLNDDFDLDFQGGDVVVGEGTRQSQALILLSEPGEWRENPPVGAGIRNLVLDDAPTAAITSEIQAQLEADGQMVEFINLATGGAVDLAAYFRDAND